MGAWDKLIMTLFACSSNLTLFALDAGVATKLADIREGVAVTVETATLSC